jgi:hypothetical protein
VEDLNIEEVKQLVVFYKQKSSDLEFNLLQMQIKLNRTMSVEGSVEAKPAIKK